MAKKKGSQGKSMFDKVTRFRLVEEALLGNKTQAEVARKHGVPWANFERWVRQYRKEKGIVSPRSVLAKKSLGLKEPAAEKERRPARAVSAKGKTVHNPAPGSQYRTTTESPTDLNSLREWEREKRVLFSIIERQNEEIDKLKKRD